VAALDRIGWPPSVGITGRLAADSASHYDYAVEKPPDEFRIAVIGASLVASTTNEMPWPDALQRYLDNDEKLHALMGVQRITVMNFGFGGASFQAMIEPGFITARRFSPDFVLLNFATTNVIPSAIDQNPCAHWRNPMDMIRQG
jgi:hypothetical protein